MSHLTKEQEQQGYNADDQYGPQEDEDYHDYEDDDYQAEQYEHVSRSCNWCNDLR